MDDNKLLVLVTSIIVICASALASAVQCPQKCQSCVNNVTDCSNSGIVNPPKDFDKNTHSINLDRNSIRVLGKNSFRKLNYLEILRVNGNNIRVIKKDTFMTMPRLMILDLSKNRIARVYAKSFTGIGHLKTLSLADNKLVTVTGVLDVLPTLFQLNLGTNKLRIIHAKTFAKNVKLHYLDLRYNNIIKIHADSFKNNEFLRYLFLNNNPLVNLPVFKMGLTSLQLVDFSNCKLKKIPHGLPPSVSDLRLGHNQITEIRKKDLENMTNLRLLALNNNKINKVAFMAFYKLQNLQEIWLRNNDLIYIPRGLPDNLRKFYMDSNKVANIEGVLFSKTSKLEYLTVENNRVNNIKTGALARLKNLKYLNLQGNELKIITKGMFSNLRNISTLTLSNNPIQTIESKAFENMENLTFLYISYVPADDEFNLEDNFLTAMPNLQKLSLMGSQNLASSLLQILDDTPVMNNLTELDLTFNDIQTLPASLKKVFPNIQALSIDGNYLVCDHRLLWLAKWMKETDVKFFLYEEPQCEEPSKNKGKLVKDVPLYDFVEIRQQFAPAAPAVEERVGGGEEIETHPSDAIATVATGTVVRRQKGAPSGSSPAQQISKAVQDKNRAAVKGKPVKTKGANRRRQRGRKRKRNRGERKRRRRRRHRKTDGEEKKRDRKGREEKKRDRKGREEKKRDRKGRKKNRDKTQKAVPSVVA